MPRPTPAQLAYGVLTVVCSTVAMLMLSQARSGAGVVLITVVALALGLLTALAPAVRSAHSARGDGRSHTVAYGSRAGRSVPVASPRGGTPGAGSRVPQASLHR